MRFKEIKATNPGEVGYDAICNCPKMPFEAKFIGKDNSTKLDSNCKEYGLS